MICWLCLAISPFFSTYDSTIRTDPGISLSIGDPFYVSVSYENPNLKIVGQNVPTETVGASLGYSYGVSERMSIFLEGGYYWPSASPLESVEHEIVGRVLQNDHGKVPFTPGHWDYQLESGWGGKIGVDFQVSKRFSVFGAYRFLKFDETYRMCNFEEACNWPVPKGGKYWINQETRDYSSIQVGFSLHL